MMNSPALAAAQPSLLQPNLLDALITQMIVGPDLREVAAVLLRQNLQALYPTLDLDPSITMVGSPVWELVDDQLINTGFTYHALTDILANQVVHGSPAMYIEGEHFLAQQPITEPEVHLPVRIDEVARLLNQLAPVMLTAYQEQQLAYWNASERDAGPRWHALSKTLRDFWNVEQAEGWSSEDCAMARTLYLAPDLASRKNNDPYDSHAYLIAIDLVEGQEVQHINEVSMIVMVGKQQERTVILAQSVVNGYQHFDTLEQLGASLPKHLKGAFNYQNLQWRLLQPLGNIFDYQACILVDAQIEMIGAFDFSTPAPTTANTASSSVPIKIDTPPDNKAPDLKWLENALPDWLADATDSDLNNYSRHLKDLAVLHSQNAGKSYLDGIAPIQEYTLSQLNALHGAKLLEHAGALRDQPTLETALNFIELRVRSTVVWGTFVVPGKVERSSFSIVELALQNLIALPLGDKTLHSTRGKTLPDWLTVDYIEGLVRQADIGKSYPALIKSKLLEASPQVRTRQQQFSQHLRIQLPLLALQGKIRQQAGLDARGYRYVTAVMAPEPRDRVVEGQTIVMRPLAFVPQRRDSGAADEVANMFVIGPEDPTAGPCLLYRPMLDNPLSQYPSTSNLLYAIQQSSSLRESVLAWLPDDARSDYANFVFPGTLPSPWAVTKFLVETDTLSTMTGPMSLGQKTLEGDLLVSLFKANAQALVQLADRQSVSNAESRWASFKHIGWSLLNSVLPFLGRTVGIAAWIWQILDQLEELQQAEEQADKPEQWAAFADLLLNLGMAITLHIAARSRPGRRPAAELPTTEVVPKPEQPAANIVIKQLASEAAHEATNAQQTLNISAAVNQTRESLATVLERFRIARPAGLGAATAEEGIHQHLYAHQQRWYAPVGENWYEVAVDDNGGVMIIDPVQPARTGPALVHTVRNEWVVDVRLRLRGGGSKSLTSKAKAKAERKATELRGELAAFENRKAAAQRELQQARQAMSSATPDTAQAKRKAYLQQLESQRADYATALDKLQSLHVFSPTADYKQKSLGYLKAQLELIHAGIQETLITYTPKLRSTLNQIEQQAEVRQDRQIPQARAMVEMNNDMIARLEQVEARFRELKLLEKDGLRLIQNTRKTLPAYSVDNLKALQVTLSRNLCLPEHSVATAAEAWSNIDQIVDSADMLVQTLQDTLQERSSNRLDERIDSLNDLTEQFSVVDERLLDFKTRFSAQVIETSVADLRQQLKALRQQSEHNLVQLLDLRDIARARPALPAQAPRAKKQFIRTRYNGVLIGEPRLTEQGLETDLVDIKSPLTDKIIATFHQKAEGLWVRRLSTPTAPGAPPNLETSLNAGQDLVDALAAFNRRMDEYIEQPGRSPGGIEYLFHQHVLQLESASNAIEQALTDSNATESTTRSAAVVNKALTDAIAQLNQKASDNRLAMSLQLPPTTSNLEWLERNKAISVIKTVNRRRLKAAKHQYLDEYTVTRRTTGQVLWYAHFVYSTSWVAEKSFVYARLKTPQEQSLGSVADSAQGLNDGQRLAYYRSMIGLEQAKRLFFKKG